MPDFAFVNLAVIDSIFCDITNVPPSRHRTYHYGYSGFSIWVFCGRMELVPMHSLLNNEVIFSRGKNIILDIFYKLGLDDGKNTIYR
jgi:hypothetical protein